MVAREKPDDGIRITEQDMGDRQGHCDSRPTIQRLLEDTGITRVIEVLTIVPFVGARHDK